MKRNDTHRLLLRASARLRSRTETSSSNDDGQLGRMLLDKLGRNVRSRTV
jgi:hypothetical protein